MKKLLNIAVALIVFFGAFVAVAPMQQASAAQPLVATSATQDCSLPYVTDVNPYGKRWVATVEVAGNVKDVRAYIGKKRVHIDKVGEHTWMLKISKGKTYTIKARGVNGWKVIDYRLVKTC